MHEELVKIEVKRREESGCKLTFATPGYEIYWGDVKGKKGEYKGKTPLSFFVETSVEGSSVGFIKFVSIEKNGEIVKGCLGIPIIVHKGLEAGDCWSIQQIAPPYGGIFIPHKGTETSLTIDIDDKREYGWIDFYGEADRVKIYIDGEHKGTILDAFLIIYLPPGNYRVEQESAGVRCYAEHVIYKGTPYHTSEIFVKAGEESIIDIDMYSHPVDPPPQYVLDAAIRHLQELGWEELPSVWSCYYAFRKSHITQEWCFASKVPEVCGYEKATHYWLASHPGFVFPKTEICEVNIQARGDIKIGTQRDLYLVQNYTPYTFKCACLPKERECTRFITFKLSNNKTEHRCDDAKIVFRKNELGKWIIDREKSSSCIDILEYTGTSTSITLTIKAPPTGHVNIEKSTMPSEIYLKIPTIFSMHVENIGETATSYRITLVFTGIDVDRRYEFLSVWSEDVAPGKSTKLDVEVTLPSDAIPPDRDAAIYEIKIILEAE